MDPLYYCYIVFNILNRFRGCYNVHEQAGFTDLDSRCVCMFREKANKKLDIFVRCYLVDDLSIAEKYLADTYSFPSKADLIYEDILIYLDVDSSFIDILLGYFKVVNPNNTDEINALYLARGLLVDKDWKHFISFEDIKYFYVKLLDKAGIHPSVRTLAIDKEALFLYFTSKNAMEDAKKLLSGAYFKPEELIEDCLFHNTNPYRLTCKMSIRRMSKEFIDTFISNLRILFFDYTNRDAKKKILEFKKYLNVTKRTELFVL